MLDEYVGAGKERRCELKLEKAVEPFGLFQGSTSFLSVKAVPTILGATASRVAVHELSAVKGLESFGLILVLIPRS
jgi:hypothetical protein